MERVVVLYNRFLDNVRIHMAHTLSLAWKESLVFVDGYIEPTYT